MVGLRLFIASYIYFSYFDRHLNKSYGVLKMKTLQIIFLLFLTMTSVFAGVIKESQSTVDFKGALGIAMRMMSDADKPQKTVEYYTENAMRSDNFDEDGQLLSSSIMDAEKGAFISIDHKEKTYMEMTFADMENMFESSAQEMEAQQTEAQEAEQADVDITYDVTVEKLGKETVNGFKAEKYQIRIDIEATASGESEEGEAYEATQPMVVNSTVWAVKNLKAAEQIQKYNEAMGKKMAQHWMGHNADMAESVSVSNPELGSAILAMQEEMDKIKGTVVKNTVSYEMVKGTAQPEKQEKQQIPTSVGGLLGGISKKVAKSIEKSMQSDVLMESTNETTKLAIENFDASVFDIPNGYKKMEMNY